MEHILIHLITGSCICLEMETNEMQVRERGERVFLSLQDSEYDIPVIGYSGIRILHFL